MILAADYSQLELRILAHLSKDQRLLQVGVAYRECVYERKPLNIKHQHTGEEMTDLLRVLQVLNGGADVFRCIAAEWKSVDPEAVTDNLRQQAKQVPTRKERGDNVDVH